MNVKNQTQDRQQILIDLYKQYLLSEITLVNCYRIYAKMCWVYRKNNMLIWWV